MERFMQGTGVASSGDLREHSKREATEFHDSPKSSQRSRASDYACKCRHLDSLSSNPSPLRSKGKKNLLDPQKKSVNIDTIFSSLPALLDASFKMQDPLFVCFLIRSHVSDDHR